MGNILAFKEVSTREFAWGKSCLTGTFSLNLEYGGNKNNDSTQKNDSTPLAWDVMPIEGDLDNSLTRQQYVNI